MWNRRKWLVVALLIATVSCSQPKELVYRDVENFRLLKAGLQQTEIAVDVRFYNPNKYALKLKHADVDVFLNGNHLGQALVETKLTIRRNDTFLLPVILNVDMQKLIPNSVQWLMNKQVDVKLQGNIKAGKGGVYFNLPIRYEGKQELTIE